MWALQPLPGGEHALYRRSSVVGSAGVCGVFAQPDLLPPDADPDVHPSVSPGDELALTEIALDADHDYYLFHDENEANVVADLETVIALMRLIYINSVAISYEITHINVHTSPTYTTTNPSMLLADFAGLWLSGQYASIPRDVAHLFTDKDLDGFVVGVAYLGQVCDITGAYGLTQSQISANLLLRTGVTSHELGHNWASLHCDGTPDCAIMCSILDACGNGLQTFGGYASAVIAQYAASASCLGVEIVPFVPVLDSVSPTWGPDEGGGVLELHGTTLPADGTLSVSIGSQTAEVLSASETLITVAVPPGPPGTTVDLSVAGDLGLTVLKKSYRYELDVEVGDTVVSEFDVLETERFYFEALADEELTLKLVPLDEEEGLIAGMRLLGPEEQVLVEFEQTVPGQGQPLTLKKFALPSTGVYRLDCFAVGITSGAYKLISKSKPLKKLKTNVAVSTAQPDPSVAFSAHAGTLLKLAHFKRFKPKGKYAEVDGEPADLVPTLLTLMGPEGEVPLGDVLELHKKGKWARVKKLMLHASGDYVLRAGGKDMTVGHGKLRVKLKPPKQDGTEFVLEN